MKCYYTAGILNTWQMKYYRVNEDAFHIMSVDENK